MVMRDSHGSQLLSSGVPLPTVSKRVGHSNVYTTATAYSHSLSADEVTAAEKWDAVFRKATDAFSKRKPS
jgi:integrase